MEPRLVTKLYLKISFEGTGRDVQAKFVTCGGNELGLV